MIIKSWRFHPFLKVLWDRKFNNDGHRFQNLWSRKFEWRLACLSTYTLKIASKTCTVIIFFACWGQDIMEDIWNAISSTLNLIMVKGNRFWIYKTKYWKRKSYIPMFLESSSWNQPLHKDPPKRKSSSETQGQLIAWGARKKKMTRRKISWKFTRMPCEKEPFLTILKLLDDWLGRKILSIMPPIGEQQPLKLMFLYELCDWMRFEKKNIAFNISRPWNYLSQLLCWCKCIITWGF